MRKNAVFLMLLLLCLLSCMAGTGRVYKLQTLSDEHERVWLHGKEYIKMTGNHVDVIIAFDRVEDNMAVIDVEIVNLGPEPMTASCELFHGYYMNANQEYDKFFVQKPIDPEEMLLDTDLAISKEDSRYIQESGINGLLTIVDLFSDLATIASPRTDEEIVQEEIEDEEREIANIEDENYHYDVITRLLGERDIWEFTALRKTTLPPNYSVAGRLYFPFKSWQKYLMVVYDEENENLSTIFTINTYKTD